MRRLDAHIHLFERRFSRYPAQLSQGGSELDHYNALRNAFNIERALVIGYEGSEEFEGNNTIILDLSHHNQWIVPLAYLRVDHVPDARQIRELRSRGFQGFSVYLLTRDDGETFAQWPSDVLAALAESARILSLNSTPVATTAAYEAFRGLAPCTVLFSHLGLPGSDPVQSVRQVRERLRSLLLLASEPNVGVKLSGLYATEVHRHAHPHHNATAYIDVLVQAFGPGRIYWGSDFAPALEWISFDQAVDAYLPPDLSAEECQQILGENLARALEKGIPS